MKVSAHSVAVREHAWHVARGCKRCLVNALLALVALFVVSVAMAEDPAVDAAHAETPTVELYFFWSHQCPHCHDAIPFILSLAEQRPWLKLVDLEVSTSREAGQHYRALAARFGEDARSVPGFIFCDTLLVGYDNEAGIGAEIEARLDACYQRMLAAGLTRVEPGPWPIADNGVADRAAPSLRLPLIGTLALEEWSLPALTVVIGGLDAFNPCAFFVLLFLLSILAHTRDRKRILLIGGIFVAISGIIYFLFMAAWLNVFLIFGEIALVTRIAGGIAVLMALINIKDYFWFRAGVTLGIPDAAKPGLFGRMRGLTTASSFPVLLGGTIVLAVAVNLYEILCTMGFPMVYTRILTLNELGMVEYYAYLVLYNLIYVLPLAIIVTLFAYTLGSRKLQEHEGRILKLVAGLMMLGLGLVLVFSPAHMTNPLVAIGLLLVAVVTAFIVVFVDRWRKSRSM